MDKLLGAYKNGNCNVEIYNDGTKIKSTDADEFIAEFPESIDLKITNKCDANCAFCHENSTIDGKHGDISLEFVDSLMPFTEVAIGGGNPLEHPQLLDLLIKLKRNKVIANITVKDTHLKQEYDLIWELINNNLIKGLGVSVTGYNQELMELVTDFDNCVLHVINGVVGAKELVAISKHNPKILMLGYKELRRGVDYYDLQVESNKNDTSKVMPILINNCHTLSFDNLAIKQLDVKKYMSESKWQEFYMGDDGTHTMYVDLVEEEFSKTSTSLDRYSIGEHSNIKDMFDIIKVDR